MKYRFGLLGSQLRTYLELNRVPPNIWGLVGVLCVLSIIIIALFVSSIFFKLDEKTQYSVLSSSEYFSYQPLDNNASDILFRNYSLDLGCLDSFGEVHTSDAVLSLARGTRVFILRHADGALDVGVVSESDNLSVGTLESDTYFEELPSCLQVKIKLDKSYPTFSMNLIGSVTLGKELTDASDGYFPLLMSGEIDITDRSLITRSPYQLTPHSLNKGNYVYFKDTISPIKGLLRATYNQSAIDGVFSFQGGDVFVQKYRSRPEKVEVSFLNRISSDSELAILLSILILAMQFVAFLISFLLRIKLIESKMESVDE